MATGLATTQVCQKGVAKRLDKRELLVARCAMDFRAHWTQLQQDVASQACGLPATAARARTAAAKRRGGVQKEGGLHGAVTLEASGYSRQVHERLEDSEQGTDTSPDFQRDAHAKRDSHYHWCDAMCGHSL